MIFFETSKNKIFFLSFFVVISTIFVALVWLKFAPDKQGLKIKAVALISDEVKTKVNDNLQNMQDSFALGTEQIKDLQGELVKSQKQAELLDVTKKYLEAKQATSTQENIK
jgi:hypothetical protein